MYIKFSKNKIIKASIDKCFDIRVNNKDIKKINFDEWSKLLFEFCIINKRIPRRGELFKNYNIASWFNNQKNKIKSNTDELYIKLSQNSYIKQSIDKYLSSSDTYNRYMLLLFEFCNTSNRVPVFREVYKKHNIGIWLRNRKKLIKSKEDEMYLKLSENIYINQVLDEHLKKKNTYIDDNNLIN